MARGGRRRRRGCGVTPMEGRYDFLEWLGPDTSSNVLMCLDDPADLARASSVSRSWRRFVIAYGFCKKLCLRKCPEVSNFTRIVERKCPDVSNLLRIVEASNSVNPVEAGSSDSMEWETLERDHRVYIYLIQCLISPLSKKNCILEAIIASSTDNYPAESIENTLKPRDRVNGRPSYWSSDGASSPGVPETLTYQLRAKLCLINEIKIQPFKAYFQDGHPIYSAKAVQFRFGHYRSLQEMDLNIIYKFVVERNSIENSVECQPTADSDYIWTYVSPVFPMVQENVLQSFKLPRPVLCIGGILQIELLGRVQRQEMDDLYYICVRHVKVVGRPLLPKFDVDILDNVGNSVLKYYPDGKKICMSDYCAAASEDEVRRSSGWHTFAERNNLIRSGRARNEVLLGAFLGDLPVEDDDDDDDDDDSDEEPDVDDDDSDENEV